MNNHLPNLLPRELSPGQPPVQRTAPGAVKVVALLALILCFGFGQGFGAEGDLLWGFDGVAMQYGAGGGWQHISDGAGGTFLAFASGGYPDYAGTVRVERLSASGAVLWGPVTVSETNALGSLARLCPDGSGGVLVAWAQEVSTGISRVYVQRVNASGIKQWPSPVAASNPFSYLDSLAVAAGYQSMFIVFRADVSIYAAHITAGGALSSPGAPGLYLGTGRTFGAETCAVPDGSGGYGAIFTWADVTKNIMAQRVVVAGGAISSGWNSGSPVTICNTTGDGYYPSAAVDGSGGALIAWTEISYLPSTKTEIRVQKVSGGGVPQWTANGVVMVDSSVVGGSTLWQLGETTSTVASDGTGGAYVAWNDWRNDVTGGLQSDDIYAQRVNASGVAQWAAGGINILQYAAGSQRRPRMVSDLAGGALVTFQDNYGYSWDIGLVRLAPSGMAWFRWAFWDSQSPSNPGKNQISPAVVYDASGSAPKGCIVAWTVLSGGLAVQKVEISATAVPINDACSGAIPLTENVYAGQNTANATDDGSSVCLGRTLSKGVWYSYTPMQNGTATIDTCPSDFDTIIEVFGSGCGALSSIGCNDDGECRPGSSLSFPCVAGTTYLVCAAGYNGASGNLQIRATLAPINDACSGAVLLAENVYYAQSTANASDDGFSPCLGRDRSKGVWFRYQPTQTGTAAIDTCPSSFDTIIEVFTGTCGALAALACNDDGDCRPQSTLSFPCMAGATYFICAAGYNGASGNLQIRASSSAALANDSCSGAFPLLDGVYCTESTTNATDDGDSPCLDRTRTKGVWFIYVPMLTGKATVDTCPSDFDTNLEVFTNACGALTSVACNEDSTSCSGYWQASCTFACTARTVYFIYAGGYNSQFGRLQIRARAFIPLPNDECSGALALSENAYFNENTTYAEDDGESPCLGRTRTKGVWFTFTPKLTGKYTIDTCPSDFDTNLELFTGGCGGLTSIGCNEDSWLCGRYWQAAMSFNATAGTTYFVYAGGYNSQYGNLQIRARMPLLWWERGPGGVLKLSWLDAYRLQAKPTLTGTWIDVVDGIVTNGFVCNYTTPMTGTTRFFRVQ